MVCATGPLYSRQREGYVYSTYRKYHSSAVEHVIARVHSLHSSSKEFGKRWRIHSGCRRHWIPVKPSAQIHEESGSDVEPIDVAPTKKGVVAEAEKVEDSTVTSKHVLHTDANA